MVAQGLFPAGLPVVPHCPGFVPHANVGGLYLLISSSASFSVH